MRLNRRIRLTATLLLSSLVLVDAAFATQGPAAQLVKDIEPGPDGSYAAANSSIEFDGRLFFQAQDQAHGAELWSSDGTARGTSLFMDRPGVDHGGVGGFFTMGGTLFFFAHDGTRFDLWRTDGNARGTEPTGVLAVSGHVVDDKQVVGRTLFLVAADGLGGPLRLWKTDGTAAHTTLVLDTWPFRLTAFRQRLYFLANVDAAGYQLWRSDGTARGTRPITSIDPSSGGSVAILSPALGTMFLGADLGLGSGYELWKTDGTAKGMTLVKDINPLGSSLPSNLVEAGDTAFFLADDGTTGLELWKTNGTARGTTLVKDITPGRDGTVVSNMTGTDEMLFFVATEPNGDRELWRSDGTAAGTGVVKDINPGPAASHPDWFASIDSTVYFTATESSGDRELWRSDGTARGTTLVADINPGPASSDIFAPVVEAGDRLFVAAFHADFGYELWTVPR